MRKCKKCGEIKPANTENFNLLPSGNYRGTCKACMAINTKKNYYKDPQRVIDRAAKYKAQKETADGHCTEQQKKEIRLSQSDCCQYCGIQLNGGGELDHKIPVSKGGDNWPKNLAWACRTCNRDKHNKTDSEFMSWRKERDLSCR